MISAGAEVPWELSDFRLFIGGGALDVFFFAEYALDPEISSFFS